MPLPCAVDNQLAYLLPAPQLLSSFLYVCKWTLILLGLALLISLRTSLLRPICNQPHNYMQLVWTPDTCTLNRRWFACNAALSTDQSGDAETSGVNLGWKLGAVGLSLKTGKSFVLKVQQKEASSTGFRVSSPEFSFNIHKISLLLKSQYFGKWFRLIFLYIILYNNILRRPNNHPTILPSQKLGIATPNPKNWRLYGCILN